MKKNGTPLRKDALLLLSLSLLLASCTAVPESDPGNCHLTDGNQNGTINTSGTGNTENALSGEDKKDDAEQKNDTPEGDKKDEKDEKEAYKAIDDAILHADKAEEVYAALAGKWTCFDPGAYAETAALEIAEDGHFTLKIDTGMGLNAINPENGDMQELPVYTYTGFLEVFFDFSEDIPYTLDFLTGDTDDVYFEDWRSYGDFGVSLLSHCDGKTLLLFSQVNNGDSVLSQRVFPSLDTYSWVFEREDASPSALPEQKKDARFTAYLLKSRYGDAYDFEPCTDKDGKTHYRIYDGDDADGNAQYREVEEDEIFGLGKFVVYADEIRIEDRYNIINDDPICVPYIISDTQGNEENLSMLSGGPDGLLPYGLAVYEITTDEKGEIVDAVFIPTDIPPDAELAFETLSYIDEVRIMVEEDGMEMLYEGEDTLWGENVAIVWLGTEHEDNFVKEVEYAVMSDLTVYRYSAAQDDWYWVDPAAMG